jgi:hypothetical protein
MKINYSNREDIKKFITLIGIEKTLQCLIEIIDSSIEAIDYTVDSIKSDKDLWKFRVLENLEFAYDTYMTKENSYQNSQD